MIHRIVIKDYRGIQLREAEIPPAGALVKGRNGAGKTSTLKALEAALLGRDIGPDAIRIGSDKAEILVDLGDVTVRRAITSKGSQLSVRTAAGDVKAKPQTWLGELFGASIDPLALLLAKPKDRRAAVVAALPCTVTEEQIRTQWVPDLPAGYDCTGHGLDVIERVRKNYYERRTLANAEAKRLRETADRLALDLAAMPSPDCDVTPADAYTALDAARRDLAELESRRSLHEKSAARTASTRQRIEELREVYRTHHVKPDDISVARDHLIDATGRVRVLEQQLADARAELDAATAKFGELEKREDIARNARKEGESLAKALEETGPDPVSDEALELARVTVEGAAATLVDARTVADRHGKAERVGAANMEAIRAEFEAERLDGIVTALTNDAPRAIAATGGIEGLRLDGDDVVLDGVAFSSLCGAQQIRFAVQVAKRANARGRVLLCDGLERLDPEQLDAFISEATADGWQLLATRVDRGDVVIEAIGAPEAQAAE